MKYWNDNNSDVDRAKLSSTESALAGLLKRYENLNEDAKLQHAEHFKSTAGNCSCRI